jgi:hypothetical protein
VRGHRAETPNGGALKPTLPPNTVFCGACGREFNGKNAKKPCLICRILGWEPRKTDPELVRAYLEQERAKL